MRIRDLLSQNAIDLAFAPADKKAAIDHLVDLMADSGCLSDTERYRKAVFERETQGSTGFGGGVAIPHAKSQGVDHPGLAAMVVRDGVDFDAVDGQPAKLLFLIASPHKASDAHLDVLAHLSTLLIDEDFRLGLIGAKDVKEFLAVIDRAEQKKIESEKREQEEQAREAQADPENAGKGKRKYDLVAVTACPAGLSHTYMAAESLEQKAAAMGLTIKVEADGAAGNRNALLPDDIANARAVIVAADRAVEMDRFIGKPLVRVGVVAGIQQPAELITRALDRNCPAYKPGSVNESSAIFMRLYRHLMSGLTYIMPLAATAGILSAFARFPLVFESQLGLFLDTIGYSLGTLLFPVLSAFIAFSIGGRTALVAGFTGGVMAEMANAGVIGALINGFVGGGVASLTATIAVRFLKGHDAMFALLVYPLIGALGTTLIAQFITNIPAGFINTGIEDFLNTAGLPLLTLTGMVLGGMMSADMGGPCNKMAYACGVLLLADCLPEIGPGSYVMAAVMAGGMTPPLAAGLSALMFGKRFSDHERKLAPTTILKGFMFITEGVFPYLLINQFRMRAACVLSSALAGGLSMALGCAVCAPHGGIFIIPIAERPLLYLGTILLGGLVGAGLFALGRRGIEIKKEQA